MAEALIAEDQPVFGALEHRVVGADLHAGRAGAVVAEARQVEEVRVGPLAAAFVLVPVGPPTDGVGGAGEAVLALEVDAATLAAAEDFLVVVVPTAAELIFAGE